MPKSIPMIFPLSSMTSHLYDFDYDRRSEHWNEQQRLRAIARAYAGCRLQRAAPFSERPADSPKTWGSAPDAIRCGAWPIQLSRWTQQPCGSNRPKSASSAIRKAGSAGNARNVRELHGDCGDRCLFPPRLALSSARAIGIQGIRPPRCRVAIRFSIESSTRSLSTKGQNEPAGASGWLALRVQRKCKDGAFAWIHAVRRKMPKVQPRKLRERKASSKIHGQLR